MPQTLQQVMGQFDHSSLTWHEGLWMAGLSDFSHTRILQPHQPSDSKVLGEEEVYIVWVMFFVCKQLMELARPSQNQLVRLMHSPFHFFFQTKPMGFSSLFPFRVKISHTSSGTKHCIKLFSYSTETQRRIKHWHLPFFTGPLGKSGDKHQSYGKAQRSVV